MSEVNTRCIPISDGERIRLMRSVRRMTQIELAQKTGIPNSWLSYFEKGHVLPTPEQVEQIQDALGWTAADEEALAVLVGGDGQEVVDGG